MKPVGKGGEPPLGNTAGGGVGSTLHGEQQGSPPGVVQKVAGVRGSSLGLNRGGHSDQLARIVWLVAERHR